MNKIKMVLTTLALITLAIACTKLETTPQFPASTTSFAATASSTTVALTAADSVNTAKALIFSWNDPGYTVGLSQSKFSIVVGPTGKNFVSFVSKDFSGVLKGTLLGKEINAMALKFGGVIGTPITLDVKVVASQANNDQQKTSNIIQVAVTPYGDLTLTATATKVVTTAATSSQVGTVFNWNVAYSGYTGVKTYQFQYAKANTSFASPTTSDISALTKSFTQLDLNKIALGYGTAGGADGAVDFRIKASNESGTVEYSNVVTVTITTYVAFNSIGIIGDATPGGWGTDTDMYRQDPNNKPADWTVTLYLKGGASAKFRADDAWDTNWGAAGFPSGTGVANGANIPVSTSGYYTVNFNAGSGLYSFTPVTATVYSKIGVIGDATAGGWSSDTYLTQSNSNNQIWTGTVALTAGGSFKFRANTDWGVNWGPGTASATGYSGWGVQNGSNISVTVSGTYFVYINTATGEFFYGNTSSSTPYSKVSVIGDATPGGWSTDTELIQNPSNPYNWSGKVTLIGPGKFVKFRANDDWGTNWGKAAFPAAVGVQNGDNIPATAGTYQITFNSATGEFSFIK